MTTLNPEEAAYEVAELWDQDIFGTDDWHRVVATIEQIPHDASTLLDAGCGNGFFLNHLSTAQPGRFGRLCGVDRSEAALAHVEVEKHAASINDLPFADAEFDVVCALEVIEHLPVTMYDDALAELARVAGKHLLITVPYEEDVRANSVTCPKCHCRFNADYHLRSYTDADFDDLFRAYGFTCEAVFHIQPRKEVPGWLMTALAPLRAAMRARRGGWEAAYPGYAVCPACGYQDSSKPVVSMHRRLETQAAAKTRLLRLLQIKSSYRWVGARYRRT